MLTIINHEGKLDFWLGRLSGGERLAGEPFYAILTVFFYMDWQPLSPHRPLLLPYPRLHLRHRK
jgi:hypothetical protein